MRSCSALHRHCGYAATLNKLSVKSDYVEMTAAQGQAFGGWVQDVIEGRDPAPPPELTDAWSWFENFRWQWQTPPGAVAEFAMGLSHAGEYVRVVEVTPHFYVPSHDESGLPYLMPAAGPFEALATGGRLDVAWVSGNVAVVLDNKRNSWRYGDPEVAPQLMALGCMWAMRNGLKWVQVGWYGAISGCFTWAPEILNVADVLPDVLRMCGLSSDDPLPGEWCHRCYEKKACKPGSAFVKADLLRSSR